MAAEREVPRFVITAKWEDRDNHQVDYDVTLMDGHRVMKHWQGRNEKPFEMRVVLEKAARLRKRALKTNRT